MIKTVLDRNINDPSKKELCVVRSEYSEIVHSSEISNGIDEIEDVCNQSDNETGPDKNSQNIAEVCSLMVI